MNFPLLNIFLTMMYLFLWILWIFLLIRITIDIFRSHDLSGWGKAAWLIFIIILPFLGVLVYVIARGGKMSQREVQRATDADEAMKTYIRQTAATAPASAADELTRLADLRDKGVITEAEFAQSKAKILA